MVAPPTPSGPPLPWGSVHKHVLICEDGDQIEVNKGPPKRAGQVPGGVPLHDAARGDLANDRSKERRMLPSSGPADLGRRR